MRLLSLAPLDALESELGRFAGPRPRWLRRPETGLVMVQARVGGSGERFNLGEATLTRCALRTDPDAVACEFVGVAYVMGRSARHAELAAIGDALLQDAVAAAQLREGWLESIRQRLAAAQARQQEKAEATRVEFFTVAREAGAETDDEVAS